MLKVCICYEITDKPWGGGNQFIKALKNYFIGKEVYEENPEKAQAFLFNSHQSLEDVFSLKKKFPKKLFIHRVDGPITLTRGRDTGIDKLIFMANQAVADATIFQSSWSRKENYRLGMAKKRFETVIINAPDPKIFNLKGKTKFNCKKKIKLITTTWSANWQRGFDIYQHLDENLDFERYEMSFLGNAPVKFKNIKHLGILASSDLAKTLKQHDIFIAASLNDPCSNSLLEALHCGLPAVFRNSGGHPELVGGAGESFGDKKEILSAIDRVAENYYFYQSKIKLPDINNVGNSYFNFIENIHRNLRSGDYRPRKINFKDTFLFHFLNANLLLRRIVGGASERLNKLFLGNGK